MHTHVHTLPVIEWESGEMTQQLRADGALAEDLCSQLPVTQAPGELMLLATVVCAHTEKERIQIESKAKLWFYLGPSFPYAEVE